MYKKPMYVDFCNYLDDKNLSVFFYLIVLSTTHYRKKIGNYFTVHRGFLLTNISYLRVIYPVWKSDKTYMNKLRELEKLGLLIVSKVRTGILIKIIDYDKYCKLEDERLVKRKLPMYFYKICDYVPYSSLFLLLISISSTESKMLPSMYYVKEGEWVGDIKTIMNIFPAWKNKKSYRNVLSELADLGLIKKVQIRRGLKITILDYDKYCK